MKMLLMILLLFSISKARSQNKASLVIHFDFDHSDLNGSAKYQLDSFFKANSSNLAEQTIQIHGHCDHVGSDSYNDSLSVRRVNTVKKYLLSNYLKPGNIDLAQGYGERQPLNSNATAEERFLNRRVEIIYPVSTPAAIVRDIPVSVTNKPVKTPDTIETIKSATNKPVKTLTEKFADTATKAGTNIVLKNINFIGGTHRMIMASYPILDELLNIMRNNPTLEIEIQGHICCQFGDSDGEDIETNTRTLSENRAHAIHDYLVSQGIKKNRVSYKGFGHSRPIHPYPELTEEERTENRRVEIKIIKR